MANLQPFPPVADDYNLSEDSFIADVEIAADQRDRIRRQRAVRKVVRAFNWAKPRLPLRKVALLFSYLRTGGWVCGERRVDRHSAARFLLAQDVRFAWPMDWYSKLFVVQATCHKSAEIRRIHREHARLWDCPYHEDKPFYPQIGLRASPVSSIPGSSDTDESGERTFESDADNGSDDRASAPRADDNTIHAPNADQATNPPPTEGAGIERPVNPVMGNRGRIVPLAVANPPPHSRYANGHAHPAARQDTSDTPPVLQTKNRFHQVVQEAQQAIQLSNTVLSHNRRIENALSNLWRYHRESMNHAQLSRDFAIAANACAEDIQEMMGGSEILDEGAGDGRDHVRDGAGRRRPNPASRGRGNRR